MASPKRQFLSLFLPLIAAVVVLALVFGQMQVHGKLRAMTDHESDGAALAAADLLAAVKTPQRQLSAMVRENDVLAVMDDPKPANLARLADVFSSLLMRNPDYDQVRWIDQTGHERVRVDKGENDLLPVSKAAALLQDKSERNYVRDTADLPIGALYFSPLDLNIENGALEIPYKPTLRVAVAAGDRSGNRKGILIINILAGPVLASLNHNAQKDDQHIMLLNRQGEWLYSPTEEDEWGSLLGRTATMESKYPEIWSRLVRSDSGRYIDRTGIWVWRTITAKDTEIANAGDKTEPFWFVLSHQPRRFVDHAYLIIWRPIILAAVALILIFAALSRLFVLRSLLRREAQEAEGKAEENRRRIADLEQNQKSNSVLTAIVESSEDAIISKTLDGVITSWNRGAEKLFGYTAGEALGQPMTMVIPVAREQEEQMILDRIGRGETVHHFETVRQRKDGTEVDVSVTISPVRDAAGRVVGASKIARDITGAKREKAELDRYRENLEELVKDRTARLDELLALQRAILDSAAYAIIATDIDGAVTQFNPAAEAMLGYRGDSVIGSILTPLLYDGAEVAVRAAELSQELGIPIAADLEVFVAKPRQGLADPREWTFIRKDGSRFPGLINITALKDAEGEVAGFLGILMDLTQQKRDDREKQRLLDILELSPDFIGSADMDGNVKYLNRAAKELVGLSAHADLATLHVRNLHPEWAATLLAEKAWPIARQEKLWRGETAVLHRDGREISVSQVVFLHKRSQDDPMMMSTIIRDITEEKWREAELAAAKDLAESANSAKGQFLTNMSHELRTPLNAILGFAQLLASETIAATAAQRKDFVSHILRAGQHLLTLINEILDLARIEAGKVTLSPEPVGLTDILCECRALMEPLCAGRNIGLLLPERTDLHVIADRTRLKQILLNLLTNAIKYNRDGGTVVVNCAVTVPHRIRISVQDTGMGLTEEQLAKLFQPFDRLGQEASGVEGTGIGLVVTKHLVEMMQGTVGVSSTVGVGSTFWISLDSTPPVALPSNGDMLSHIPAVLAPPDQGKAALLYVEDNPANLKLVEEIIGFRKDLRMISAHDGHLGVELARAHLPRVILMDIHLPGMSGLEAQQILRSDPRTAHIPVIALTASAMPREVVKGMAAGFFRYITKPIDIAELTAAIDEALALPGSGR